MKIGLFLLVSLVLHATALTYPVFFPRASEQELIPVLVLSMAGGSPSGHEGRAGREGREARLNRPKPVDNGEPINSERETPVRPESPRETPIRPEGIPEGIAVASEIGSPGEADGTGSTQNGTGSVGEGASGTGNSGDGRGAGAGGEEGDGGLKFAQVSHVYNPKPRYPEKAREDGREGTVILRVLVDEEGGVRSVEVNRSSGFEAFDRAAIDAISRWRFSPARYGERRVESWVRIPIVFRLADAKD